MYSTPIFPHKYWQGKLIESKYCKSFWTLKDWAISSPFCGSAPGKAPRAANMSSRIFSSATFGYYVRSSCFTCYRRYRQAGEMGLWYDMAEKRPADSEPVCTFLLFIYCTIHNLGVGCIHLLEWHYLPQKVVSSLNRKYEHKGPFTPDIY